jgi:hypothetical protein
VQRENVYLSTEVLHLPPFLPLSLYLPFAFPFLSHVFFSLQHNKYVFGATKQDLFVQSNILSFIYVFYKNYFVLLACSVIYFIYFIFWYDFNIVVVLFCFLLLAISFDLFYIVYGVERYRLVLLGETELGGSTLFTTIISAFQNEGAVQYWRYVGQQSFHLFLFLFLYTFYCKLI